MTLQLTLWPLKPQQTLTHTRGIPWPALRVRVLTGWSQGQPGNTPGLPVPITTANENIMSTCEFIFNKDIKGEMLIPKDTDKKLSEFILTGIFEIDARNFFMTSDGKWNFNNPLSTQLKQVKPTCHLLPVLRDKEFSFSAKDYPTILANICSIEKNTNSRKPQIIHSTIIDNPQQTTAIRLTHHLFFVCPILFLKSSLNHTTIQKGKKITFKNWYQWRWFVLSLPLNSAISNISF